LGVTKDQSTNWGNTRPVTNKQGVWHDQRGTTLIIEELVN